MAPPTDDVGDSTVRALLEDHARLRPDALFAAFEDGTSWTYRHALEAAYGAASELRRAGVERDGLVGIALPNGAGFLRSWLGAAVLGATVVPINTSYRGRILSHLLELARPAVVVTTGEFEARFDEDARSRTIVMDESDLRGRDLTPPELVRPLAMNDAHAYCMTSGTTGPSKLARLSYAHSLSGGDLLFRNWGATPDDVYLADMAMFLSSGVYFMHAAMANGCRLAVRTRPSLDTYWEVARDTGATITQAISTMVAHLEGQPTRQADRQHSVRTMLCLPLPKDVDGFRRRFGVANVHTSWASTEVPGATCTWPGQTVVPGFCGRLRPGFQVRLVDEFDREVPPGEAGEAIIRADRPWLLSTEYLGAPEATVLAWRNGWFHSGDLLRRDERGNYFFVDRSKDALRRRGQNISSFEVERAVASYAGVSEVACVPERSGVAVDDEVKVWLVPETGVEIDFESLLRHCVSQLPHYMVPRYFEAADALPKTPSAKIQKYALRERGNSDGTWDRVAHGLDVTRHGLRTLDRPVSVGPVSGGGTRS